MTVSLSYLWVHQWQQRDSTPLSEIYPRGWQSSREKDQSEKSITLPYLLIGLEMKYSGDESESEECRREFLDPLGPRGSCNVLSILVTLSAVKPLKWNEASEPSLGHLRGDLGMNYTGGFSLSKDQKGQKTTAFAPWRTTCHLSIVIQFLLRAHMRHLTQSTRPPSLKGLGLLKTHLTLKMLLLLMSDLWHVWDSRSQAKGLKPAKALRPASRVVPREWAGGYSPFLLTLATQGPIALGWVGGGLWNARKDESFLRCRNPPIQICLLLLKSGIWGSGKWSNSLHRGLTLSASVNARG